MIQTYYTYSETTKSLTQAPDPMTIDGRMVIHPLSQHYASMVPPAYPLSSIPAPTPSEGKIAVVDGYELIDGKWSEVYRFDDLPEQLVIPSTPTQAQVADVVKKIVVLYGGIVEGNAS